jgi:two-component system sensor histidine kinase YesM
MKDIRQTRGYVLTLASLLLLLLLFVVSMLIRHFDRQLQVLLKKFESVETGDMVIREHLNSRDELGKLDRHFNHMVEQLQQLIHKNYISQLEKREAQLERPQIPDQSPFPLQYAPCD